MSSKTKHSLRCAAVLLVVIVMGVCAPSSPGAASGANRLLVGNTYLDSIVEFDVASGDYVRTLVPPGSGGLDEPADMIIGPDGVLYVVNAWGDNILKYDVDTGDFLGVFASGFDLPNGLAYSNGSFYVSTRHDGVIFRLAADTGQVTGQTPSLSNSLVWWPWDAEISPGGKLLMSNYERGNILAFNGQTLAYEGVFSSAPSIRRGGKMEIGPDGNVYIVSGDSSVHRYDGLTGAALGVLNVPGVDDSSGLGFSPDGDLYVVDHRDPGIYHLDGQTWDLLGVIDSAGAHTSGSWCVLVIPEPATLSLLAMGGFVIVRRRKRRGAQGTSTGKERAMKKGVHVVCVVVVVVGLGSAAMAGSTNPIIYEGFAYSSGSSLNNQGGGDGWVGPWSTKYGSWTVTVPGKVYADGMGNSLPVAGGSVDLDGFGTAFRTIDMSAWPETHKTPTDLGGHVLGKAGEEIWISFLGGPSQASHYIYGGVSLFEGQYEKLFMGDIFTSLNYGLESHVDGAGTTDATDVGVLEECFFLVRLSWAATGDSTVAEMWLNPRLDGEAFLAEHPSGSTASVTSSAFYFDRIRIAAKLGGHWDEVRLGTSYAQVVPEPATLSLLAMGGLAIVRRRKRRGLQATSAGKDRAMKKVVHIVCAAFVAGLLFALSAQPAAGQFATGFEAGEGYLGQAASAGEPAGPTQLVPQNGWADSHGDFFDVHTYAGSQIPWTPASSGSQQLYTAPVNLTGGDQFVALGNSDTGNGNGRDFHAATYAGLVEVSADFCNGPEHEFPFYQGAITSRGDFSGAPGAPAGNYVGLYTCSASTYVEPVQPDPPAPRIPRAGNWAFSLYSFDPLGDGLNSGYGAPGAFWRFDGQEGFDDLLRETWWRIGYVVDLDPASPNYRKIVQLKSQDLREAGPIWIMDNPQGMWDDPDDGTSELAPTDMYILGGDPNNPGNPNEIFPLDSVGIYNVSKYQVSMYDNVYVGAPYEWQVVPEPATIGMLALSGLAGLRRRTRRRAGGLRTCGNAAKETRRLTMLKQTRSITMYVSLAVAVLILIGPLASTSRGDFTLWNDEEFTVDTQMYGESGMLYDSSHVRVVSGGHLPNIYAYDRSTVTTSSGGATGRVDAYHECSVDMSGGYMSSLYANGAAGVNITDGSVLYGFEAHDSSTVSISGGSIAANLKAYDAAQVDISSASMHDLYAYDTTTVNISSGSMNLVLAYGTADMSGGSADEFRIYGTMNMSGGSVDRFGARYGSVVEISGGSIASFSAENSSITTFDVRDYRLGAGLTLDGERLLGSGHLSYEWHDGTRWTTVIDANPSGATVLLVPEPATMTLLALLALSLPKRGGVVVVKRRKRKRRV